MDRYTNDRLTYKSSWGDYGGNVVFDDHYQEICAYRNKLGKFEDMEEWHVVKEEGMPKDSGIYLVTFECFLETRLREVGAVVIRDGNVVSPFMGDVDIIAWRDINLLITPYMDDIKE